MERAWEQQGGMPAGGWGHGEGHNDTSRFIGCDLTGPFCTKWKEREST